MDRGQKIEVLEGLKVILKFVEIYPADWFYRDVRISIPFIFRPFLTALILFQVTTIWLCFLFEWDINLISGPLCFLFGGFQILTIYFIIIMQSKSIIVDSTDLLQHLVQRRK